NDAFGSGGSGGGVGAKLTPGGFNDGNMANGDGTETLFGGECRVNKCRSGGCGGGGGAGSVSDTSSSGFTSIALKQDGVVNGGSGKESGGMNGGSVGAETLSSNFDEGGGSGDGGGTGGGEYSCFRLSS
ncbi:hypothetical protein A2U01_0022732, partial [Trifolium medium]|nr:hypothetical protein [Trifolium medium]